MRLRILIKNYRHRLGVSQKVLRQKTGIPQSTLSDIENGKSIPNIKDALIIAEALNCRIEDLFVLEREPPDKAKRK